MPRYWLTLREEIADESELRAGDGTIIDRLEPTLTWDDRLETTGDAKAMIRALSGLIEDIADENGLTTDGGSARKSSADPVPDKSLRESAGEFRELLDDPMSRQALEMFVGPEAVSALLGLAETAEKIDNAKVLKGQQANPSMS